MGTDKRYVSVHGTRLLDRVLSVLLDVFPEVLLVLAEEDLDHREERARIVTDLVPGRAAVGGLYTGLSHSQRPRVFVVACDMPFLNRTVIEWFCQRGGEADIVLAHLATGLQPFHGVYAKTCLPVLQDMVECHDLRLQNIVHKEELTVHRVPESEMKIHDPRLLSFLNLNSPADVEFAKRIDLDEFPVMRTSSKRREE